MKIYEYYLSKDWAISNLPLSIALIGTILMVTGNIKFTLAILGGASIVSRLLRK